MVVPRGRHQRRLRRILALPAYDIALGLEALLFLAVARLLLLLLPFARAMRLLGLKAGAGGFADSAANGDDHGLRAIGIAIRRASRVAPFRAVCLQQAVAANLMLRCRRRASDIHFGVVRENDGAMSAHAWTCCAGHVVTGSEGMAGHIPIAIFAAGRP